MTTTIDVKAGRKEWIGFAVLALPLLLVSMDVSVLYFAIPYLSRDLHASATQQLWILDVYGFVLAGLLLTMGAVGDRIGRRRLLLIGAAGFSAASLVAAFAPNSQLLIAARALLGIAGATLMPSTLGLLRTMFPDEQQRAKAIGAWTAILTGGIALGPVLSGVLLEHFWWGSVFLINLPAMALLLILGPILLPEHRSAHPHRWDLTSAVLSLATVLPVVYGIKEWAADGFSLRYPLSIVVGLACGLAFWRRQRADGSTMLDPRLLQGRFGPAAVINALGMFALVGNAVFMTGFLQLVKDFSPLAAALWSLAPSILVGAAAPLAAALGQRYHKAVIMAAGLLVGALGFGILTLTGVESMIGVLIGASLLACGVVAMAALVTDIAMLEMDPARAGTASAVLETSSELGGALGIAVLGSIGAAVYHHVVQVPAGVSAAAAASISDSLAGAHAVLPTLSPDLGAQALEQAKTAFMSGLHGAAVTGAILLLAGAALCLALLRTKQVSD